MSETTLSTSDQRVVNSTVRHSYRILSESEKEEMLTIKDLGQELIDFLESVGSSRELSIAITNIEQAVMWAVKHVTK